MLVSPLCWHQLRLGVSSVGFLAQLMFAWTFPWSCAVPSRPVVSLAVPYLGAHSEEREVRRHLFGGIRVTYLTQDTISGTSLRD